VPQLQRSELERACEDFSNIVASHPYYTVYKGTLSSGVEITVVSTTIKSSKDWSKHSEDSFRKKIDSLSRINHKNFINLLGFCEEEEPFMRVMVFEYAPNGTLYENLHDEGFDHIDWRGRMRIIMGVAYCIQHMHELNPAKVHPDLHSSAIFLSEDSAAKIILECIQSDPMRRPSISEITTMLRETIAISPDAATPRLSPLWWAELEVLSPVEAR
ncbi:hypothetical protein E2562_016014, partial [Oryza meyeriana var. granulata]